MGCRSSRVAGLRIERQADQAAAMSGHEVDGFRRNLLGRDGEIAFVFAIFIIHHDKDLALPEIFNRFRDGSKMHAIVGRR